MNQSELKALRARLQARQAHDSEADRHALKDALTGGAALVALFLILAFI